MDICPKRNSILLQFWYHIKVHIISFFMEKGPAVEATDAPQLSGFVQPCDEDEEKNCFFYFSK